MKPLSPNAKPMPHNLDPVAHRIEECHQAIIALAEVLIENLGCEGHADLSPQITPAQSEGLLVAMKLVATTAQDSLYHLADTLAAHNTEG